MRDDKVDRSHGVLSSAAHTAAESALPIDDIDQVDHSRRRLLTAATAGIGAVGVVFAAVPFISSWEPSERAKALGAPVSVDASKLEEGQMLKVVWRGQPIFVVRRSKSVIDAISKHDDLLADPGQADSDQPAYIKATGPVRARNPEYWVGLAVCTHLRAEQCVPGSGHGPRLGLARRLLLSVPRLEVRHLGTGVQEHARPEESAGAPVCVLGRRADPDRRGRSSQIRLKTPIRQRLKTHGHKSRTVTRG
jgi:ubiquinol-cytochrome c reductase iron-sulfur subunit